MSETNQQNRGFETWDFPVFEQEAALDALHDEASLNHPDIVADGSMLDRTKEEEADTLLEKKLMYLDSIACQMTQRLSEFDTELFPHILTLIKKTVKKIILKELACDDSRFPEMIASEAHSMMRENQACVVYVCSDYHELFDNHVTLAALDIRIDETLAPGDFIIKNSFSELQAILEQRLNRLFGC